MKRAPRSPRSIAFAVLLLGTALFAGAVGLDLGGETAALHVDDLATAAAAAVASALCVAAARRHDVQRRSWALLAVATGCWAVAEAIWAVYDLALSGPVPVPSWADVGYLAGIPIAIGALLAHPATLARGGNGLRLLLDGLVVAAALLFLSWTSVLEPLWSEAGRGTAAGVVGFAYPFGDVVLVFFVVLAVRGMSREGRLCLWYLLAGLTTMAITDSAYAYMAIEGFESGGLIDTGWFAAYLCIALSAAVTRPVGVAVAREPAVARTEPATPSLPALVAPLLVVLIALATASVQIQLGYELDLAAIVIAFGLVALVLARA